MGGSVAAIYSSESYVANQACCANQLDSAPAIDGAWANVSEHQTYEFLAVDRPLTDVALRALRGISSRAEITRTRFWNEYDWGDLKADPARLLARYFDLHLYTASWGSRRLMLRFPRAKLDPRALRRFLPDHGPARLVTTGGHAVIDVFLDEEHLGGAAYDAEVPSLATLSSLRAELLHGDLRPAYLLWLLAVQAEAVDDDVLEPPVPPGLSALSASQTALVDFIDLAPRLIEAAARRSARPKSDLPALRRWIKRQPLAKKDAWLVRAAAEPELALGGELLGAFRAEHGTPAAAPSRTAGELRTAMSARRGQTTRRGAR